MRGSCAFLPLLACLMLAAPAQALPSSQQNPPAAAAKAGDGLVCEKEFVIGSRLKAREVCATPEERARRRLQERQGIERAQASPCLPTTTDSLGHSHC